MGARQKAAVLTLLQNRDQHGLKDWVRNARAPLRVLFSLTYSADQLIRWRAIEGTGLAAQVVAEDNIEGVRVFLRSLLWLMNDESGGIGWSAPEAIGEVLLRCPRLKEEFGSLLPQFLVEEPFERGTNFALFRLRHQAPELIRASLSRLEKSLGDPDPAMRAYSWLNLAHIGFQFSTEQREAFARDDGKLVWYDFSTGKIVNIHISEIAEGRALTIE